MEIYGGRAGFNFVCFTGVKYQSIARFKNEEIKVETKLIKKNDMKESVLLSKIPFVRAFILLFNILFESWKLYLSLFILFVVSSCFTNEITIFSFMHTFTVNSLVVVLSIVIIASIIIKATPIGKYHAAEHMVANASEKDLPLTKSTVRKQSRMHDYCGTNLVVSFLVCFTILYGMFGDSPWMIFIGWSIGYEVWRNEPKLLWALVLRVGKAMQYILFTSRPKDKHLLVAIEALKKLEEKEMDRR